MYYQFTSRHLTLDKLSRSNQGHMTLKSEFISSCSRPAVGSNIVQITRATFFVNVFKKMAAGSHFGCRKITWYRISYHFRSIPQFLFCEIVLQNGCRRPFWMSENHVRSHFWPFQINTKLLNFFFSKWLPSAILDVRNSLWINFWPF